MGITKVPASRAEPSALTCGLKNPHSSHHSYHADSTALGLYVAGNSVPRIFLAPLGVTLMYATS